MASLIGKIAVFGRSHVRLAKNKRTRNVSPFGADFGQKASSDHTFCENEADQAATVNGARYRDITQFLFAEIG